MRLPIAVAMLLGLVGLTHDARAAGGKAPTETTNTSDILPPSFCVRSEQSWIRSLVMEGDLGSPTFHRLLVALGSSDVIVYIVTGAPELGKHEGRLLHHTAANESTRYLRIVLSPRRSHEHLIGLLAHELQHAREVAVNPYVRTSHHIRQLFERIGFPVGGGVFETRAAQEAEGQVVAELRTARTTASRERPRRIILHNGSGNPRKMEGTPREN